MDWLSIITTGAVAGVVLFLLVALTAMVGFKHLLRDDLGGGRQSASARQLVEAITLLQRQSHEARTQMQALARAQKRLADDIDSLQERVGKSGTPAAPSGPPRLLH